MLRLQRAQGVAGPAAERGQGACSGRLERTAGQLQGLADPPQQRGVPGGPAQRVQRARHWRNPLQGPRAGGRPVPVQPVARRVHLPVTFSLLASLASWRAASPSTIGMSRILVLGLLPCPLHAQCMQLPCGMSQFYRWDGGWARLDLPKYPEDLPEFGMQLTRMPARWSVASPTSARPAATAMAAPLPVPLARHSGSPGYSAAPSLPNSLHQHSRVPAHIRAVNYVCIETLDGLAHIWSGGACRAHPRCRSSVRVAPLMLAPAFRSMLTAAAALDSLPASPFSLAMPADPLNLPAQDAATKTAATCQRCMTRQHHQSCHDCTHSRAGSIMDT